MPPSTKVGLRVTVRLCGTVVAQRVHWPMGEKVLVGATGADAVPTPSGNGLVWAEWTRQDHVVLDGVENNPSGEVSLGDTWHWADGQGVEVDIDLVPAEHAQRRSQQPQGDFAFFALLVILMTGASQFSFLYKRFSPSASGQVTYAEPTPELITRLLQNDLDGEEQGASERVDRADFDQEGPSFFMPSGNEGPKVRDRGGANQGEEVHRPDKDAKDDALAEVTPPEAGDIQPIASRADSPDPLLPGEDGLDLQEPQQEERAERAPRDPVERFIGWGFRDWLDQGEKKLDPEMERTLDYARVRLKLDPEDPYALQVVGYYAYLAENMELCQGMYDKYTRLYPDDPSGYNNLALTYKRSGDYQQEETLYRQALKLDPLDEHVLNNLAVNLAHQGRHDEALVIMDQLEELTPGDPYADLHRAKIFATMGKKERAFKHLKLALKGVSELDTLHHIEFRQDIRLDPAFAEMRGSKRFQRLLRNFYGADAKHLVGRATTPRSPFGGFDG